DLAAVDLDGDRIPDRAGHLVARDGDAGHDPGVVVVLDTDAEVRTADGVAGDGDVAAVDDQDAAAGPVGRVQHRAADDVVGDAGAVARHLDAVAVGGGAADRADNRVVADVDAGQRA